MIKPTIRGILGLVALLLLVSACNFPSQSPALEEKGADQAAIIETEIPPTESNLKIYSTETYSFSYPIEYTITLPTQSFPALTIEKARNQRVEIFQMKDFGRRPWGFSGDESQEDIDGYVPKETLTVGSGDTQFDVWLFYSENDSQTKEELIAIFDSILIN